MNFVFRLSFVSVLLVLFNASPLLAHNKDSLLLENDLIEKQQLCDNLDSLLNLWYIDNAFTQTEASYDYTGDEEIPYFSDSVIIQRLNKIPSFLNLTYNEKVREWIDLYTKRNRKQISVLLGLSNFYFPIFEEILDKYDLPLELKYLPIIESALNPRAVSRAGATGIWQFMYTTGKLYKLDINSFIDERRDPVKSTHAAARFLKDLYTIYGDWTLVIAAYNCGPGNVNKAIKRAKGKTDYWEIYNYLPRETRGYVPAYIAAVYSMTYYKEHKILPRKIEFPIATDTIMIDRKLHLNQVSGVLNIPVEQLRDLNPQYKKDIIPSVDCAYSLKLPTDFTSKFIELKDSIYGFKDSIFFKPSAELVEVTKTASYSGNNSSQNSGTTQSKSYTPTPPSENSKKLVYSVKQGDNLGFIATWYNVSVNQLKDWNNMYGNNLQIGQQINVYVPKEQAEKYSKINDLSFDQKQKMVGKTVTTDNAADTKTNVTTNKSNTSKTTGKYEYYTVKAGDNFWSISKKFPGTTSDEIMKINGIRDAGSLKVGQKLKIRPIK